MFSGRLTREDVFETDCVNRSLVNSALDDLVKGVFNIQASTTNIAHTMINDFVIVRYN